MCVCNSCIVYIILYVLCIELYIEIWLSKKQGLESSYFFGTHNVLWKTKLIMMENLVKKLILRNLYSVHSNSDRYIMIFNKK